MTEKETTMSIEKLRPSFTFTEDRLKELHAVVPEAFSDGKINWDVLREALGEYQEDPEQEHFGLTWPGKREAKRLASLLSKGTLLPQPGEGVNEENTRNIFIEGDNLEVLKLLQKSYARQVKLIYIDPPYNTGNDFVYADDYSEPLNAYLSRIGQIDEAGKPLTTNGYAGGRYHSNWLNMMYPRLLLARRLLKNDGLLFVSIDDHELDHLRLIMNEIFGEECFKNSIIVRRGVKNVQAQFETIDSLTVGHEYIVMYSRNAEARFPHFKIELDESRTGSWNNHWRGTDRPTMRYELLGVKPETGQWRWSKERSLAAIDNYQRMVEDLGYLATSEIPQEEIDTWYLKKTEDGEDIDLLRLSRNKRPEHYIPPSDTKMGSDLWTDLSPRDNEFAALMGRGVFNNPKPIEWLKRIINFATAPDTNDIVMDFFAGSASTAHAVLAQNSDDEGNRRFVLVQLPEPINGKYKNIAEISRERIRKVLKNVETEGKGSLRSPAYNTLGFRSFKLASSNFKLWENFEGQDVNNLQMTFDQVTTPLKEGWTVEGLLVEILLQQGFPLDVQIQTVESNSNRVLKITSDLSKQTMFVCLDATLHSDTIGLLDIDSEAVFICFDSALNDQQKIQLSDVTNLKVI